MRFGSSPVASEVETSVLPQHVTDAGMSRPTGPTTVLDRQQTIGRTHELSKPKRSKALALTGAVVFIAAIAVTAYFYLSRKNNAAINSIAVLPFQNASGDPNMEYLSDGIAESLMNSLSQLPNLKVMSRNTAFRYKGKEQDAEEVGKELNVRAVLTGRLKQVGDQIVISVSLDDARDSQHLWGAQYDRKTSDLLSMQREIARDITGNLRLRLTGEEQERLIKDQTENTEAYLLYLKGRYHTARYTKEDLNKGLDYFGQAIAKDPRYAPAYDGLAYYYLTAADWFLPAKEALPKAGDAARQALELDDTLAEAHTSLAMVHWWFDWDWPAAETEFKRSLELKPNDARAHEFYGWYLITMGRDDSGVEENKRAQALDPLSVETNTLLGQSFYFVRRYDQAIGQLRNTLDMDQSYWLAHSFLGRSYQQQGKQAEAMVEFQRALQIENAVAENRAMIGNAYALSGRRREAEKIIDELKELSLRSYVPPYNIATVYAGLGDKDQAFIWLDRAYADRSFYMTWIKVDPQMDSLRPDPRFADLVRRMGLTQ